MALSKSRAYLLLFGMFVAGYAAIFLICPHLGVTDDFVFLRTLETGKPILYYAADFPYYDSFAIGRFTPAVAMEYNLALLFTDQPGPSWYYAAHALQFVAFVFFMTRILGRYVGDSRAAYLMVAVFVLTAGFTYSWFRLQLNERNVLLLMAAFVYCYLRYQDERKLFWLVSGGMAAVIAVYYKETAFIMVGSYAAAHLLLSWRESERDRPVQLLNLVLLGASIAYVLLYVILVLPHGGVFVYGKGDLPAIEVLIKNFSNYLLVTDPVIFFVVFPLAFWRIYRIFVKRDRSEPFHDALLVACILFVSAYFVLNLFSVYYFQPVYALAVPPIFHFLRNRVKSSFWRYGAAISVALVIFNSLPLGLHYLTFYKYAPANFNAAVDFISRDIRQRNPKSRPAVFIDGVDKGSGKFIYFIFSEFFLRKGLTPADFDLRSSIASSVVQERPFPFLDKIPVPYTVFQKDPLPEIAAGDYLVLSPHSTDSRRTPGDEEYIKSLEKDFNLLFRTSSPLAFPLVNLKEAGRYLLSVGAKPGDRFLRISRHKPSPETPDYYVFIRK